MASEPVHSSRTSNPQIQGMFLSSSLLIFFSSTPQSQTQNTHCVCLLHSFYYVSERTQSGRVTVGNFRPIFKKLKGFSELFTEDEIKDALAESHQNMDEEIDFESFLRVSFCFKVSQFCSHLFMCNVFLNLTFTICC